MRVKFGMLMTDAVGKAGGQYIRSFRGQKVLVNITRPSGRIGRQFNNTPNLFSIVSSLWKSVSSFDKNRWSIIGNDFYTRESLDNKRTLSGREMFLKCNIVAKDLGLALVDPNTFGYRFPSGSISADNSDITISLEELYVSFDDPSFDYVYLYAKRITSTSEDISNGVFFNFYKGNLFYTDQQLYSGLESVLGRIYSGDNFIIYAKIVSQDMLTAKTNYVRVVAQV